MIVRQFLQWVRQAPPGERAEATSALARAYLYSDLSADDLAAAEGAMIMLLDDASPLVRRAMAEAFASAEGAPQIVVHALASDQPDVALPILAHSPLLVEDDLVDLIATGDTVVQVAIAGRQFLTRGLAAAIAEVGSAEACLTLLENPELDAAPCAAHEIVADTRRLCCRTTLAGAGARRIYDARSVREGNRRACRRHELRRGRSAGAAFAPDGATHGGNAVARI